MILFYSILFGLFVFWLLGWIERGLRRAVGSLAPERLKKGRANTAGAKSAARPKSLTTDGSKVKYASYREPLPPLILDNPPQIRWPRLDYIRTKGKDYGKTK